MAWAELASWLTDTWYPPTPAPVALVAVTRVGSDEVTDCWVMNSVGSPTARASADSVFSSDWMLVSCLFIAVRPLCWFCRLVTGC